MYEVIFLSVLALIFIVFATIQDLKSREVADWLNFSLIIFALGFRFFYSLFSAMDFSFFYQGLIGFGIFLILGNIFYYGRMFAGGDAKLMIALGTILPFYNDFFMNVRIFILFLFLFLFSGAFYGLVISLSLTIKNFKRFKKEFLRQFKKNKKIIFGICSIGLVLMLLGIIFNFFFMIGLLIFVLPYFYFYAKAVDEACMIKKINSKKLTPGDWLYKKLNVGKKFISPSWEGVGKKDIKEIQKNYKQVEIRQGIAFVPVFLISFVILLCLFYFGIVDLLWGIYF